MALLLILFQAVVIAFGLASPLSFRCCFLNTVALVRLSNAPGLLAKKVLIDPRGLSPLTAFTTALAPATPATAFVISLKPLKLAVLGNAVLATPLTSIPAAAPI